MKQLSVSQLNNYIKGVFDDELILHDISVTGEIFEIKAGGGNTYLTLKDGDCALACVYFGALGDFIQGEKVRVCGAVGYYPKGGKLSFIIKSATHCGEGVIIAALNKLKKTLDQEGVFDNNRPLKRMIRRVALITSGEGAVLHDFVSVLSSSAAYADVSVFDVRVQGEGAASEITEALSLAQTGGYDAVVIARGGGSGLDLGEFNSEALARAVYASAVPVISAVGHETDYTLCDFAADYRAGTPSIAAETIAKNNLRIVAAFTANLRRIKAAACALVDRQSRSVRECLSRCGEGVAEITDAAYRRLVALSITLSGSASRLAIKKEMRLRNAALGTEKRIIAVLSDKETAFKVLCAKADGLSPLKLLSKGYARVTAGGKPLKGASAVKAGDSLNIMLCDGDIKVTADSVTKR